MRFYHINNISLNLYEIKCEKNDKITGMGTWLAKTQLDCIIHFDKTAVVKTFNKPDHGCCRHVNVTQLFPLLFYPAPCCIRNFLAKQSMRTNLRVTNKDPSVV